MKQQKAVIGRTLTSRDVGETENALRALLDRVLVGTGLDYHRWVALKVASEVQPPLATGQLARLLVSGLKIDEARAFEVIEELGAAGVFVDARDVADTVTVSTPGAALFQRLNGQVQGVAAQMYAGLDVEDLAVAYRVMATLTERANALLAQAG